MNHSSPLQHLGALKETPHKLGEKGVVVNATYVRPQPGKAREGNCVVVVQTEDGKRKVGICNVHSPETELRGKQVRATVRLGHVLQDSGYRVYMTKWVID